MAYNINFLVTVLGATMMVLSCNSPQNNNGEAADEQDSVASDPVETKAPNTDYQPAFEGQTRAPGVETTTAYEGRVLSSDLDSPWGITSLPDGRLLITEKEGT